jgi:hypothetical protein
MKKMILAAGAAVSLGTSVPAFAQPRTAAEEDYGRYASIDHRNELQVHLLGQGTVTGSSLAIWTTARR